MEPSSEGEKKPPPEGEPKSKRKMKTASQLEILEKTYAVEAYPSESLRAELSVKLGLSDRQLQMWFCHRRLKDRKAPPVKRQRRDAAMAASGAGAGGLVGDQIMVVAELGNEHGSGSNSGSSPLGHVDPRRAVHRGAGPSLPRIGVEMPAMKRFYEPPQSISELRAIAFVEAQLGEPLREDGPILGMEFDPLPPDAFGAPLANVGQQKQAGRTYDPKPYERLDSKVVKGAARAVHEYQFLPEQPTARPDPYERVGPSSSHYYQSPTARSPPLSTGRPFMHGNELVPTEYGFQSPIPSLSLLPQQGRHGHHVVPSVTNDYDSISRKSYTTSGIDAHFGSTHPIIGLDNAFVSSDRQVRNEDEMLRMERKRKSDEARIAKEVEAHEKRIRKELERQDILRRKREEQMRKEMERHDRERRKEEERLLRERQREEERYQREQRRDMERREKFLQKQSIKAEKMRQKEALRREKEAARQKAATERATARRIAKESMELIEDERLELMEIAASRKGLLSILALDSETLQNLDLFRELLSAFPPKPVQLKRPFAVQPWVDSEENVGNLLMVWRFLITFADVLGIWPLTLDEFVQAFHDYDPRLLGEIHIALLKSIIKDIEDVARTPSTGLGANQNSAANPGGGHPHIVEGAYGWGFDIRSWQSHLNPLTWPEILRQFALSAGFGPKLKKQSIGQTYFNDDNEGNDCADIISNLRNGAAAENAVAIMQEKGFSNPRRSRHRLTPGTVKFAAFHVLSLEGSKGLTILDVADKIQKSGLRDLTTSKTPEASIAAALSRDTALFERTAPSTYCLRTPFRKNPADAEAILSAARERIRVFKCGFLDGEGEEEADDVERDEDSESDMVEDAELDDLAATGAKPSEDIDHSFEPNDNIFQSRNVGEGSSSLIAEGIPKVEIGSGPIDNSINGGHIIDRGGYPDLEDTDIDESSAGEPWVQGLMEGEYSSLSIEERLNALVALIGVAIEGNSIRVVLEERLEAANALKKQMWAEAQLDKRRLREEYVIKMQNPSSIAIKIEANTISASEGKQSPLFAIDEKNGEVSMNQNDLNNVFERNLPTPDNNVSAGPENTQLLPTGHALEKSRSQYKAFIGYKAEEMYVYRSLPLGQDRRRNRYWQFITSYSRNDPGTGRIFVELRSGSWRLIDSTEGFDSLLASLDVRGVRESHLFSMLQKIEISFKKAAQRNRLDTVWQGGVTVKAEAYTDSPTSGVSSSVSQTSDPPSSSFAIELGRNKTEKHNALTRYQDFQKWMWKECFHSLSLCATKYGKQRCAPVLSVCGICHDSYIFEDNHCPSCHRTFGSSKYLEHAAQCEEKQIMDPDWTSFALESSYLLRIRLLKSSLANMEVSIPLEALHNIWTEDHRKSWGLRLHCASSAEELLKILAKLENVIKRDWMSSNFETTIELLGSSNESSFETGPLLPWVPQTTAAMALRLMDLDASLFYSLDRKVESQKDKGAGDFTKLPSNYAVAKNTQDNEPLEAPYITENLQDEKWIDSRGNLAYSGRGRGIRGRGRGRTRGGGATVSRSQRRIVSARSNPVNRRSDNLRQVVGSKGGRTRGRGGRRRGRRSIRNNRQKPIKKSVDLVDEGETAPQEDIIFGESSPPQKMDWNEEDDATMPIQASSSSSSQFDDDDDDVNGQEIVDDEEYDDDMVMDDYGGDSNGKSDDLMEGTDDDNDDDGDEEEEEEEEDDDDGDVERYINGDSDEDGNRDDEGLQNKDGEDGAGFESSSSSEYSD